MTLDLVALVDMGRFWREGEGEGRMGSVVVRLTVAIEVQVYKGGYQWCSVPATTWPGLTLQHHRRKTIGSASRTHDLVNSLGEIMGMTTRKRFIPSREAGIPAARASF